MTGYFVRTKVFAKTGEVPPELNLLPLLAPHLLHALLVEDLPGNATGGSDIGTLAPCLLGNLHTSGDQVTSYTLPPVVPVHAHHDHVVDPVDVWVAVQHLLWGAHLVKAMEEKLGVEGKG